MKKNFLKILLTFLTISFFKVSFIHGMEVPLCILCTAYYSKCIEYQAMPHHYKNYHNHKSRLFYLCNLCDHAGNASQIRYHYYVKHRKDVRSAHVFDHIRIPHLKSEDFSEKQMQIYSNRLYALLE